MIASYDELKSAVADFLLRDDLTTVIPTFIRLAEARIDRELRHWRQEKRSNADLDAQFSALPADFMQPISLSIVGATTSEVAPMSVAQMAQLRAENADRTGRPTHYAVTAQSLELYPTPDVPYTASLVYHGRIPALSATNTTNWLLTEAPDVYLYGACLHSAPYLKDDQRIAVWESFFKMSLDNLMASSIDAKWAGTGLKMKTKRGAP